MNDGLWHWIRLDKSWLQVLTPNRVSLQGQTTISNITTFEALLANSGITGANLLSAQDQTAAWNYMAPGSSNRTLFLECITIMLIADGISRFGSDKVLNTSMPVLDWTLLDYNIWPDFENQLFIGGKALYQPIGVEFQTFDMTITIQGLAYQAQYITDFLATTVLLAYILLALVHTIYLLYMHKSSWAWDSVIEVLTLAYNSCPTSQTLQNTSAGIKCI